MAAYATASSPGPSSASASAIAGHVDISGEGANLYYPALLSNAIAFFGAGLCWRLDKASAALDLSAAGVDLVERGLEEDVAGSTSGKGLSISEKYIFAVPDPVMLLMAHVLEIDKIEVEAVLIHQVGAHESGVVER